MAKVRYLLLPHDATSLDVEAPGCTVKIDATNGKTVIHIVLDDGAVYVGLADQRRLPRAVSYEIKPQTP